MRLGLPFVFCALGAALRTAGALYIGPGCIVKSQWQVKLSWPNTYISVWIPPGETFTVFDLEVAFKGHDAKLTRDRISITSDEVSLTKIRQLSEETNSHQFQQTAGEGWRDYRFSLKDYAISSLADNKTLLLNASRSYEPVQVGVTGSNVTVNCFSDVRVWNVAETPATVPLDGGTQHFLSVFSVHESRPIFTLGKEDFSLSHNQKGLMAVNAPDPLPAFEEHNFTLTITPSSPRFVTCYIKLGGDNNTQIPVANELRRKLTVKSSGKQFYLLLRQPSSSSSDLLLLSHEDGDGGAVVALSLLLAIAVLGLIGVLFYIWTLKKTRATHSDEEEPLIDRTQPSVREQPSLLLAAVIEDNIPRVRALLSDRDNIDSALVEAHLLRRTNVIPILKEESQLKENDVIKKVLKEYRQREEELMVAAKSGSYRLGVDALLRRNELPATLRDAEGRTILHHAASARDTKGAPLWTADNIRSFLANHTCFVNAVDYQGRTCLHLLAQDAAMSSHEITWDGLHVTVSKAWLRMAKLLVLHGCRPGPDSSGEFPHESAKRNGLLKLATYLEQAYQHSVRVKSKDASLFQELVTAVRGNSVKEIRNLLLRETHLLPLDARHDPLTEAVRRGHLEAATMLLSAGAPLCGRPLVSITPLEAAHGKADLPGLLPAILRKEYVNKLKHEANIIKGGGRETHLRDNVEKLAAELDDVGPKATWVFLKDYEDRKDRSKMARELLCAAAGLGLPLTCQMFGLEDVHLHPLPREANPVSSALKANKQETLYVLFRDLHMSLSLGSDSRLPQEFLDEVLGNEIKNFEKHCKRIKAFAGKSGASLKEELDRALEGSLKDNISKDMLLIISRYGLVLLLQRLRGWISFNTMVHDLTGFTMLHISALYGTLAMVEYLLFNGADIACKSRDGFTAEEVAAMKGNRECMEYLEFYRLHESNDANKTSGSDLANVLAEGYKAQVEDFSTLLLPEEFGMGILSEPQESTMMKLLLKKKIEKLGISDNDSFRRFIEKWRVEPVSKNVIEEEVKNILKEVVEKPHSKFIGRIIQRHSEAIPEGNFPYDSLQIYWQVDSELYKDFQIRHNSKDRSVCSIDVSLKDGTKPPCLSRFKEDFYTEIRETLLTYKFKTPNVWLTYPCIYMMFIGVTIYLLWQDDKGRTRQVRVLIVPVLKTDYPGDASPPPLASECLQQGASVYVTSIGEGRQWTYVMTQLEEMILYQLTEEKKLVLLACKFLEAVLNPCWWFPREQSRRHGRTWRSYAVSLSGLADTRQLLTLFLEEVSETRDEQWEPSKFLERVLSVYRRATRKGEVRADVKIFLDPKHSVFTPSDRVLSVTDFLSTLITKS